MHINMHLLYLKLNFPPKTITLLINMLFCCCCSVAKPSPTICDPIDCNIPGFSVLYYLLEFSQIHVLHVGDAIKPSHPLPPPSPFAFNLSQHQGLFHWVDSSHQETKVLELQLQHQFFQWIFTVEYSCFFLFESVNSKLSMSCHKCALENTDRFWNVLLNICIPFNKS